MPISTVARSRILRAVKSTNTKPELILRRALHSRGFRYRLHSRSLPGRPDLALPGRRKVIFVNGCFWHQHPHCSNARLPQTNRGYWLPKLKRNVERDAGNIAALRKLGWDALVVWECELANIQSVLPRVLAFLSDTRLADRGDWAGFDVCWQLRAGGICGSGRC